MLPSIANKVEYLAIAQSTSNYIANCIKTGSIEYGLTVLTYNQTDGRGQRSNTWFTGTEKNVALSFYLNQDGIKLPKLFYLNKLCSLAIHQVVIGFAPNADVKIKWPNDVLINEKKVAGILVENVFQGNKAQHICGIGLNVNEDKFPDTLSKMATSLYKITGKKLPLNEVCEKLFFELNYYHSLMLLGNYAKIDALYHSLLLGLNQVRTFVKEGVEFNAIVLGVNKDGLLRLQNANAIEELLILEPKTVEWRLKP